MIEISFEFVKNVSIGFEFEMCLIKIYWQLRSFVFNQPKFNRRSRLLKIVENMID